MRGLSINIYSVQNKRSVVIPQEAKSHLVEYIAIQMKDLDDQHLHKDLDKY